MKKFLTFILCLLTIAAAGCGTKTPKPEPEPLRPGKYPVGDYTIVYAAGAPASTVTAANELQKYINSATGETLEIVTDAQAAKPAEVLLGKTNRPESDKIDYSVLGSEGFTLKTDGNKLLIAGDESSRGKARGVLYGAYSFLELLGFRFLSTDVEVIPEAEAVFIPKTLNKTEIPKLEFRDVTYGPAMGFQNAAWAVKQKINSYFTRDTSSSLGGSETFAGGSGATGLVHTMRHLVPVSSYYSAHPEYFAQKYNGQRDNGTNAQVCYTNPAVFDITLAAARIWLTVTPDAKYISISTNDSGVFCQCNNCKAAYNQYGGYTVTTGDQIVSNGGGLTGVILDFTNRIAEALENDGRANEVIFLAYGATEALPKGGIVPRGNVVVQLAGGACGSHGYGCDCTELYSYNHAMGSYSSADAVKKIEDWHAITKKLLIYDYCANYYRNNAPFPNYRAFYKNIKTYAERGAKGIFSEGVGHPSGEFGELKAYLFAKMLWNPDMSETEYYRHMHDFVEGYYGPGSQYIQEYIDLTMELTKNMHFSLTNDMYYIFHSPADIHANTTQSKAKLFAADMDFIEKANGLFYNAMYYAPNPETYRRVEKSSIQVMFYELYMTMNKRYSEGGPEQKQALADKNQKMYNLMKQYGTVSINSGEVEAFITAQDGGGNELYPKDWKRSPKTFILQREGLPGFISKPY